MQARLPENYKPADYNVDQFLLPAWYVRPPAEQPLASMEADAKPQLRAQPDASQMEVYFPWKSL